MKRGYPILPALVAALGAAVLHAPLGAQEAARPAPMETAAAGATNVVEIVAEDYALDAPDAISSGWTTFRFTNQGEEHHTVFIGKLPEGKTSEDYELELWPAFNAAWAAVRAGEADFEGAMEIFGEMAPDWFVEFMGGPGYQAPGVTSEVTLHLEPGNYVLECYFKTEEGEPHYMEGMSRPITVLPDRSTAAPPATDARITLTNFDIALEGELVAGTRTIAVRMEEAPEGPFGHSVHFARLDEGTTADDVVGWLNWFAVDGLRTPAPAHFVGGTHGFPVGQTAYVTVDLEPGTYLIVSEATAHEGVMREFTVR